MKQKKDLDISEIMFKIIMIGNSAVGKSCLLIRYIKDKFQQEY